MRTIEIAVDRLGGVTLSDSLLGMVGEHNNTQLLVTSEDGFFSDADFFRMCFGRYETAALYPVDGVISFLVPGAVTGATTKSWQLAGYRFDGQTPLLVKKSEMATFTLLPSAQPQAEVDTDLSGTIEEEIRALSALVDSAREALEQADGRYVEKEEGKSLSSNDYTDAEKENVAKISILLTGTAINNYKLLHTSSKAAYDDVVSYMNKLLNGSAVNGRRLSANDYTAEDKAVVAGHASDIRDLQDYCTELHTVKADRPVYTVGNTNADNLTTPGIYATSYAGPQNFPFIDSAAMPFLIVAEAGRMPSMSEGAPDFSEAKTLMQACIGKGGELYCRYKIPEESGSYADWAWSAWSTKAVSVVNSLTSTSTTAALSAAQGKALNDSKVDKVAGKGLSTNDYTDADKAKVSSYFGQLRNQNIDELLTDGLYELNSWDDLGVRGTYPISDSNFLDALLIVQTGDHTGCGNYVHIFQLWVSKDGLFYRSKTTGTNAQDWTRWRAMHSTNDYTDADKAKVALLETSSSGDQVLTDNGAYRYGLFPGGNEKTDTARLLFKTGDYTASGSIFSVEMEDDYVYYDGDPTGETVLAGDKKIPTVARAAAVAQEAVVSAITWQTLAEVTVAEGEEASSFQVALPEALADCNELMIEAAFYVGTGKSGQAAPSFCIADADRTAYACWLGGGDEMSAAAETGYLSLIHTRVGADWTLSTFGAAGAQTGAVSPGAAYSAQSSAGYRTLCKSNPAYLYCDIEENTFAAGTKIKLLGRR